MLYKINLCLTRTGGIIPRSGTQIFQCIQRSAAIWKKYWSLIKNGFSIFAKISMLDYFWPKFRFFGRNFDYLSIFFLFLVGFGRHYRLGSRWVFLFSRIQGKLENYIKCLPPQDNTTRRYGHEILRPRPAIFRGTGPGTPRNPRIFLQNVSIIFYGIKSV